MEGRGETRILERGGSEQRASCLSIDWGVERAVQEIAGVGCCMRLEMELEVADKARKLEVVVLWGLLGMGDEVLEQRFWSRVLWPPVEYM